MATEADVDTPSKEGIKVQVDFGMEQEEVYLLGQNIRLQVVEIHKVEIASQISRLVDLSSA